LPGLSLSVIPADLRVSAPPQTGHGTPQVAAARIAAQVIHLGAGEKGSGRLSGLAAQIVFSGTQFAAPMVSLLSLNHFL
jgi:hypothetical protein